MTLRTDVANRITDVNWNAIYDRAVRVCLCVCERLSRYVMAIVGNSRDQVPVKKKLNSTNSHSGDIQTENIHRVTYASAFVCALEPNNQVSYHVSSQSLSVSLFLELCKCTHRIYKKQSRPQLHEYFNEIVQSGHTWHTKEEEKKTLKRLSTAQWSGDIMSRPTNNPRSLLGSYRTFVWWFEWANERTDDFENAETRQHVGWASKRICTMRIRGCLWIQLVCVCRKQPDATG